MKLIQKLALDHPDDLIKYFITDEYQCPEFYGYDKHCPKFCLENPNDPPCEYCWGREYIQKEEEK